MMPTLTVTISLVATTADAVEDMKEMDFPVPVSPTL